MYRLDFFRNNQNILRLEINEEVGSSPRKVSGDDSWFDYNFRPDSKKLEKPIQAAENPKEWAVALADSYKEAGSPTSVQVTEVSELVSAPGATQMNIPPAPPGVVVGDNFITEQELPYGGPELDRFNGMVLSGWWRRVGALLTDTFIIYLVIALLGLLTMAMFSVTFNDAIDLFDQVDAYDSTPGATVDPNGAIVEALIFWGLISLAFGFSYYGITMSRKGVHNGQSLGKQVFNITVVKADNSRMGFWYAFLRQNVVIGMLFGIPSQFLYGIPSMVDYLWPLWDKGHEALHDKIVKTRVVRTDIK